jgi:hypothetical protein
MMGAMRSHKVALTFVALIPFFLLSSCGQAVDPEVPSGITPMMNETPSSYTVTDSNDLTSSTYVRWHGRTRYDDQLGSRWFNFTNAGFEVSFSGTSLEGFFYASESNNGTKRVYLAVCVDGDLAPDHARIVRLAVGTRDENGSYDQSKGYYAHPHVCLVSALPEGNHTVRVYKRSESAYSWAAVKSISTDGKILPIVEHQFSHRLEVYGDSVTCGYAIDEKSYSEPFTTQTENSLKAYENLAANQLNADLSCVSAGGFPMYESKWSKGCVPDAIPDYFSLTDLSWSYTKDTVKAWDNSSYIPDAVVIALGCNDNSVLSTLGVGSFDYDKFVANFEKKYRHFLDQCHAAYPDAVLVCSDEIIPIPSVLLNKLDQVSTEWNAAHPTWKQVSRLRNDSLYDLTDHSLLPGEGHPNAMMHEKAADLLVAHLKSRFGE